MYTTDALTKCIIVPRRLIYKTIQYSISNINEYCTIQNIHPNKKSYAKEEKTFSSLHFTSSQDSYQNRIGIDTLFK